MASFVMRSVSGNSLKRQAAKLNSAKVFDQLKNMLGEQHAWASTANAKVAQAEFICLLHNLLLLVEDRLLAEGIENRAELDRKAKSLAEAQKHAAAAGRTLPSPVVALQRFTQRSVKLLRWPSAPASSNVLPGIPPRLTSPYYRLNFSPQTWTPFLRKCH